jgi:hypothetical protein
VILEPTTTTTKGCSWVHDSAPPVRALISRQERGLFDEGHFPFGPRGFTVSGRHLTHVGHDGPGRRHPAPLVHRQFGDDVDLGPHLRASERPLEDPVHQVVPRD